MPHHDGPADKDVYLRLYFDEIPYPLDQRDAFKAHILSLQKFWQFRKARLKIRLDDIAEINSKKHTIQQCMDIVLGAMAFVLNKKHLETAPGTNERGKSSRSSNTEATTPNSWFQKTTTSLYLKE